MGTRNRGGKRGKRKENEVAKSKVDPFRQFPYRYRSLIGILRNKYPFWTLD